MFIHPHVPVTYWIGHQVQEPFNSQTWQVDIFLHMQVLVRYTEYMMIHNLDESQ